MSVLSLEILQTAEGNRVIVIQHDLTRIDIIDTYLNTIFDVSGSSPESDLSEVLLCLRSLMVMKCHGCAISMYSMRGV